MREFFDHIVTAGQNLFDLAVQRYGSVAGVFTLMADNPEIVLSLDTRLKAGDVLKIRIEFTELDDTDQANQRLFRTRDILVNTGDTQPAGDYNDDYNDDYLN